MLDGDENVNKCLAETIDYEDVLDRVALRRKESMDFLINALNH